MLSLKWDKTFSKNPNVNIKKVKFVNRFGIKLVGDLYTPKNFKGKLKALAICGPFGAVKEQSSGLYAQELASRGYLTLAFDPSFTGESGGKTRFNASPDINTEDFQSAVDYLINLDIVDKENIGIIGICGWGGIALNTACLDTRIKVTIPITMYNLSRNSANGYFDEHDNELDRYNQKVILNNQRTIDYKNKKHALAGGVIDPLPDDAPNFVKDYYAYYKTKRGYHKRSLNSNKGWNIIGTMSYMNQPILAYSSEIRSAVLMIHGEKAHSLYFSKDEFKKLKGDNKELLIIPNATHTDLYDNYEFIPFDYIDNFLKKYLN